MGKRKLNRQGSPHEPPEVRRAQVLEAAIRCFGKDGYRTTTMDAIAKESGLSKGSLYRFFVSKDDLLLAILDEWETSSDVRLSDWDLDQSPLEQLHSFCQTTVERIMVQRKRMPIFYELCCSEAARTRLCRIHTSTRHKLSETIQAGIDLGEFKNVSAVDAADTFIALMEGLLSMAAIDPSLNVEERFSGIWNLIQIGLVANNGETQKH